VRRRRREAGFTLIEVVVAFVIVTIILAALYQAIAGAWRGYARTQMREQALALARAHLEAIGIEEPLQPGERTGTYTAGLTWQLTVEPAGTESSKGRAFRILLETLDPGGRPLLRLETFKLDAVPN
jgi:prepilin-type N-terminal cleavage/methylation domain-containing protein